MSNGVANTQEQQLPEERFGALSLLWSARRLAHQAFINSTANGRSEPTFFLSLCFSVCCSLASLLAHKRPGEIKGARDKSLQRIEKVEAIATFNYS